MRKVELIYLHALFVRLHEYLAERTDEVPGEFAEYDRNRVGPYQIQRRKDEHELAVRRLSTRLAAKLSDRSGEHELQEA